MESTDSMKMFYESFGDDVVEELHSRISTSLLVDDDFAYKSLEVAQGLHVKFTEWSSGC